MMKNWIRPLPSCHGALALLHGCIVAILQILETDAPTIVNRVGMKAADGVVPGSETFSEGNLNSMFASARESLARSLLK